MDKVINQLLVISLALSPLVSAFVSLVKISAPNLKSNFIPLVALAIGIVIGAAAFFLNVGYTFAQLIIAGAIAGLASCGLYKLNAIDKSNSR